MQMLRSQLYEIELKKLAQRADIEREDENWMGFPDSQLCDAAHKLVRRAYRLWNQQRRRVMNGEIDEFLKPI
jgi:hypothetical protein